MASDTPDRQARVAGLKEIVQLVEGDLARVEALLEEQSQSDVPLVGEIGRYIREGGGKRIRPALLLLAAKLAGHHGDRAVLLGGVVEFLHTATLLHDDIIDGGEMRRGKPSASAVFGLGDALVAGDFIFCRAFAL